MFKSLVSDLGGSVFSFANIRPNAKTHCVTITKKHLQDIRELTMEERNDILLLLKDTASKNII